MHLSRMGKISFLLISFLLFHWPRNTEGALPFGIFPILPTEWYYKPTPTENVVLGLILVKVLAIRLAAVVGLLPIPYHLNDLFTAARFLGKRSVPEHLLRKNLTLPQAIFLPENSTHIGKPNGQNHTAVSLEKDVSDMFRIFSDIRRMDRDDCFLKTLCLISSSSQLNGKYLAKNKQILHTIRYLHWVEKASLRNRSPQLKLNISLSNKTSVMDIYMDAITSRAKQSGTSCTNKYSLCALPAKKILKYDSLIMPLF